jgi:hypothetical protein
MKGSVIVETLAGISFLLAIFGLVHHYLITGGVWWEWSDIWHHESLIVLCCGVAIALMVGKYASVPKL